MTELLAILIPGAIVIGTPFLIAMVGDTWLELFDGGYKTATTKSRLNAILSEHGNSEYVYQKNFEWFVSTKYGDVPFNDGIKLN